jgi:hypothetical protein
LDSVRVGAREEVREHAADGTCSRIDETKVVENESMAFNIRE